MAFLHVGVRDRASVGVGVHQQDLTIGAGRLEAQVEGLL
jgi:hypothetical protein